RREKEKVSKPDLEQFCAAQVRSALVTSTQNFDGSWVADMGYGVLDVARFVDTLSPAVEADHTVAPGGRYPCHAPEEADSPGRVSASPGPNEPSDCSAGATKAAVPNI